MAFEANSIKNKKELFFFALNPFASFAAYILSPRTFLPLFSIILYHTRGNYNRGPPKNVRWTRSF
jgi:hypothetical protein